VLPPVSHATSIAQKNKVEAAENEHIRLLKLVRDTHVWSDGRRYCEVRAEAAWKDTISGLARAVGESARKGREQEEGLEVGRFKHLDMEFQRRIHTLRMEEIVLKSRCVWDIIVLMHTPF
jgi:hypothetical protein